MVVNSDSHKHWHGCAQCLLAQSVKWTKKFSSNKTIFSKYHDKGKKLVIHFFYYQMSYGCLTTLNGPILKKGLKLLN
jgi:hypothetical protein